MLSPEDPRLAARASGDLPPEEAARLDAELAESPEARERLAELIAMQAELKAAFAAEARAEERLARDVAEVRGEVSGEFARPSVWRWWRETALASFGQFAALACVMFFIAALIVPSVGKVRETSQRSVAGSNLRQLAQASLIVASDNKDVLPGAMAVDVWDYARLAALHGGLNDASIWVVGSDPAATAGVEKLSTVMSSDGKTLDPGFASLKPSWAVALHPDMTMKLPSTTPIAWTRGLLPDGTWAPHAPFGTDGGHIVFLGGNVKFFRNTKNEFVRFDGQGMSSSILDALPPGARISEYTPNSAESEAWAKIQRVAYVDNRVRPLVLPVLWGFGILLLFVQAIRRRWPFSWFLWYLIFSFLAAVILPGGCG